MVLPSSHPLILRMCKDTVRDVLLEAQQASPGHEASILLTVQLLLSF